MFNCKNTAILTIIAYVKFNTHNKKGLWNDSGELSLFRSGGQIRVNIYVKNTILKSIVIDNE